MDETKTAILPAVEIKALVFDKSETVEIAGYTVVESGIWSAYERFVSERMPELDDIAGWLSRPVVREIAYGLAVGGLFGGITAVVGFMILFA